MTEFLFLSVDGELEAEQETEIRHQVESCEHCAREEQYIRSFLRVLRERCGRESAPRSLKLRILRSFDHRRS